MPQLPVDLSLPGEPARDVRLTRVSLLALQSKASEAETELRRVEVDDFVEQRLRCILRGETPAELRSGEPQRLLVIHVVPLSPHQSALPAQTRNINGLYRPLFDGADSKRGRRSHLGACLTCGDDPTERYALVFDTAAVEIVDASVLSAGFPSDIVPKLRNNVRASLNVLQDLQVPDSGALLYVAFLRVVGARWLGDQAQDSEAVGVEHVRLPALALSSFTDQGYTNALRARILQVVGLD